MSDNVRPFALLFGTLLLLASQQHAFALIMGGSGPPHHDPGWPAGTFEAASVPSVVQWMEGPPFGGGQWIFSFRGDTDALNESLEAFGKINAPDLEVIVHASSGIAPGTNDETADWTLEAWVPRNFHYFYNNPCIPKDLGDPKMIGKPCAPRLTVFLGGDSRIDWAKVKLPVSVKVTDLREEESENTSQEGGVISGVVYDMGTGKPIGDAEVTLTNYYSKSSEPIAPPKTHTDSSGGFRIEAVREGGYHIDIKADGYTGRRQGYFVAKKGEASRSVLYLAKSTKVEGIVTDSDDKPLAGVNLKLIWFIGLDGIPYEPLYSLGSATTGSGGAFVIEDMPEGYFKVHTREQWHINRFDAWIPTPRMGEPNDFPNRPLRLTALQSGSIAGKVFDSKGKPLSGEYTVDLNPDDSSVPHTNRKAVTDADGGFKLNDIAPGKYSVSIEQERFDSENPPPSVRVVVKPGQTTQADLVSKT